jgi:LacI family transcriptional regulator, galactose operon repressor
MVTIKDLAKELNLSHSVVSRALNPNPDKNARVAEKTRELIKATAKRMGFKCNRIAEFMKRGRAATIGVFIPEFSNRLVADLMTGISEVAAENGFPLNFYFGQSDESYEKFILQNIKNPGSGIISYPFKIKKSAKLENLFQRYIATGGKVLLLNTRENSDIPVAYMDESHGTQLAAERLKSHDCFKYLIDNSFTQRTEAFLSYMQSQNLEERCMLFSPDDFAKTFTESRKHSNGKPVGIFAVMDTHAAKFIQTINKSNAEFGKDAVLVGYDDLALTAFLDPPLTTIHQPFHLQGRRAVEKLINLIYGKTEHDEAIKPFLVERKTG